MNARDGLNNICVNQPLHTHGERERETRYFTFTTALRSFPGSGKAGGSLLVLPNSMVCSDDFLEPLLVGETKLISPYEKQKYMGTSTQRDGTSNPATKIMEEETTRERSRFEYPYLCRWLYMHGLRRENVQSLCIHEPLQALNPPKVHLKTSYQKTINGEQTSPRK